MLSRLNELLERFSKIRITVEGKAQAGEKNIAFTLVCEAFEPAFKAAIRASKYF